MTEQHYDRATWPMGPSWSEATQSSYIDSPLWLLRTLEDEWATTEITGEDTMPWQHRRALNHKNLVLRFNWRDWDMHDLGVQRGMVQTSYVTYKQYTSLVDERLAPINIPRGGEMGSAEDFLNWATQDLKGFSFSYRMALRCPAPGCGVLRAKEIVIPKQRVLVSSLKTITMFELEHTQVSSCDQVLQSTFRFGRGPSVRACSNCGDDLEQAWLVEDRLPRYLMVNSPWRADGDLILRTTVRYQNFDIRQRKATYQMAGLIHWQTNHFIAWRMMCNDDGTFKNATVYNDMLEDLQLTTRKEVIEHLLESNDVIVILTKIEDIEHIDPPDDESEPVRSEPQTAKQSPGNNVPERDRQLGAMSQPVVEAGNRESNQPTPSESGRSLRCSSITNPNNDMIQAARQDRHTQRELSEVLQSEQRLKDEKARYLEWYNLEHEQREELEEAHDRCQVDLAMMELDMDELREELHGLRDDNERLQEELDRHVGRVKHRKHA